MIIACCANMFLLFIPYVQRTRANKHRAAVLSERATLETGTKSAAPAQTVWLHVVLTLVQPMLLVMGLIEEDCDGATVVGGSKIGFKETT